MSDKLLRVNEVAEILRVSPMTILRWCNSGHLPCIKIGASRRIRESDLEFILKSERGPQKLKAPEPERPVYVGPPADQNGFDSEADEQARQKELTEKCEELGRRLTAKKASTVIAPAPLIRITNKPSTGMFPSGFDELLKAEE